MEYQKIIHFIDNNIADGVQPKTLRLETLTTQAKCCTTAELQKPKKNWIQNNSETVTNENDKEIHTGRYISSEERKRLLIILTLI